MDVTKGMIITRTTEIIQVNSGKEIGAVETHGRVNRERSTIINGMVIPKSQDNKQMST